MICLHHLLEHSADLFPDKVAFKEVGGISISFQEANQASNRVASTIRSKKKAGARIGVFCPKSISAVVALFGILKSNSAYVPLPVDSPSNRMKQIIDDCELDLILCSQQQVEELQSIYPELAYRPIEGSPELSLATLNKAEEANSPFEDLAFILYTSGSTGKPKGVCITHANALSFVNWCSSAFQPTSDDNFSSHAAFHFDLSVFDLFVAVKHSATLLLIDEKAAGNALLIPQLIAEHKISIWYSTPTILKLVTQFGKADKYDFSALRTVLFAGEVYHVHQFKDLKKLWPNKQFFNLYGPTETNVCTYFEVPKDLSEFSYETFPIGKDCDHCTSQIKPVDDNPSIGELWISGNSVAVGYWNQPDLNSTIFETDKQGVRWYKTGDLVEVLADGNYYFRGRIDRMIKRKGYRVEPGEIESALHKHDLIIDAAVIPVDGKHGTRIVAYYQSKDKKTIPLIALKQFCSTLIPNYMLPDQFVSIEVIPKTSTHKTDYKRLELNHVN